MNTIKKNLFELIIAQIEKVIKKDPDNFTSNEATIIKLLMESLVMVTKLEN